MQRVRSVMGRETPAQVSLSVVTLPGDEDAIATQIGRLLNENLSATGIDSELRLMPEAELRRKTLIENEYDIFVAAHPGAHDPDFLRSLLHSSFSTESGWQNPFGFTDIDIDELLDQQRRKQRVARQRTVDELQREIARQQPFTVVSVPDEIRAVRTDRFSGWGTPSYGSPLDFVALDRTDETTDRLRVAGTDSRVTQNLNPIAIEFRNRGLITGLLYDSLGQWYDGAVRPWAASEWTFDETDDGTVGTVRLRPDLTWHDGTPLTAEDITFTVRFLRDTSRGEFQTTVPAPRFRGRISPVESVEALDDRQLRFRFTETNPQVAKRALTVPIFPRSEWENKSRSAEIAGVSASNTVTEALVWENPSPVGSGVFKFDSIIEGEQLVLTRNDEHFLSRDPSPELPAAFLGGPPADELSVRVVRSDESAVQLLEAGEVDAVVSNLNPDIVPRIGRSSQIELRVGSSRMFYLVGFNTNREPLGNPHFRRYVARLLDKEYIVQNIFDSYGTPVASPLAGTEWLASSLRWDGADPEVPFFGTDGDLDVEAARDTLRNVGFEFNDRSELLEQ